MNTPATAPADASRFASWRATAALSLAALVTTGAIGWYRYGSPTAALDALSGASLLVDSDGKHLGRVAVGDERSFAFRLTNRSSKPIVVIGAKVSCSCLGPENPPWTLAAGQSRPFLVRFRPKPRPGRVTEQLTLYTDDPTRPIVVLTVAADVVGTARSSS